MSPNPTNAGFSFVELLISMLLVAVLYAVVLSPSEQQVRRKKFAECAERLRKSHLALNIYAADHSGAYPTIAGAQNSDEVLSLLVPKCTSDTSIFACPSSGKNGVSFAYAMGLKMTDGAAVPLVSDTATNHGKHGANVVFIDGHVEQFPQPPARELKLPNSAAWLNPKL
jgi:prepilin-type processing-associated H-X9-DG protein